MHNRRRTGSTDGAVGVLVEHAQTLDKILLATLGLLLRARLEHGSEFLEADALVACTCKPRVNHLCKDKPLESSCERTFFTSVSVGF